MSTVGKAYLIGAGPGDPGLLTLRGRQLLSEADVVLYDYLVEPRILAFAQPGAELVCLGRHGHGRLLSQEDIHERMIAEARAGRTVARLKGGDPAIFGRTYEELAALEAAGVPYEIVPGVTAGLAASSYAGVPLTHRDASSCVALVTGQEGREKSGEPLDMAGLAKFPGTLVFYMGVTSAPGWAAALMEHGKSPATPVVIVRRVTLPEQKVYSTTLGELPEFVQALKLRPPAVIIVGEAVAGRTAFDWFAARPLVGRSIMVTRPVHQIDALGESLAARGARVIAQPAIEIVPPRDPAPLDTALAQLGAFAWVVFSSANGVRAFVERLAATGRDLRALSGVKIAAIGPATTECLSSYHLSADMQPEEYRAEALAESLLPAASGLRVLLVRASRGREALAETLAAGGADVTQVVAYESQDVTMPDPDAVSALAAGRVDWITVTSSAIARSLVALFGEQLRQAKLAAISPLTAGVLADAGFPPAAVAETYTAEGIVAAILAVEA